MKQDIYTYIYRVFSHLESGALCRVSFFTKASEAFQVPFGYIPHPVPVTTRNISVLDFLVWDPFFNLHLPLWAGRRPKVPSVRYLVGEI